MDEADISLLLSERFKTAFDRSPISSHRQLASLCSCSGAQINKISNGDLDHSRNGVGLNLLARLAHAMGTTVDALIPVDGRPSAKELMRRYQREDPRIEHYTDILEYCDIYTQPRGGKTRLRKVGARSLLAEKTKFTDPTLLQVAYERWPDDRRKRVFDRQLRAWDLGAVSERDHFDERYFSSELRVDVHLLWSGFRVNSAGSEVLLIHCEPL